MANTYNGFSCTPAYYNFPAVDGSLARSLGAGPSGVQVNPFQAYQPPQIPQVPANYWSQIMSAQQSLMGGWSSFGGCQPQCPPQTGQQNHCPTQTSHQPPASEQHHCKGGHHEHGRTVINVDVHHYRCRDGETRTCGGPFSGAGTSASSVSQNFSAFGSQGGYSGFPSCGTSPFGGYSGSFGGGYEASYGGSYGGGYEASYGGGSYGGGYQGSYGGSQSSYGSYGSGSFGGYESSYGGYQSSYGGYQSSFGGYQSNSGGYQSSLGGYSPYGGLPNYGGALGSNYPQMQLQANPDYNSAFAGIRGLQTMSLVGSALSLLF